ncbi:MAG: DUF1538 domain-containing protein [Syntrophomonadaceae bacterium]|nr:DUF1538 domain-containing protein [Syntrophomonadaceae bacterium]MDD3888557.1 DUF1538 domain-containing protein [Syntrophomonadaceae bacterium]MDD4548601.1 DUF1538 domain-containing protein [Syntrophomonadaceae bacterium]
MTNIQIFTGFSNVLTEVAWALIPLGIILVIAQLFLLKLPKKRFLNVIKGLLLTFVGLALFLQGVYVGFMPVGEEVGKALGSLSSKWVLIPIGLLLGFVTAFAEPAVHVLTHQVEKVSGGYISQKIMLYTLSIGIAVSVALAMARIIWGIPLWYLILPGYLAVFILVKYSKQSFIAIAFDSGSVTTGPMTVTFILAMALGVASTIEGRNPMIDGFGLVALVALAPILTVLILGLLYGRKEKQNDRKLTSM